MSRFASPSRRYDRRTEMETTCPCASSSSPPSSSLAIVFKPRMARGTILASVALQFARRSKPGARSRGARCMQTLTFWRGCIRRSVLPLPPRKKAVGARGDRRDLRQATIAVRQRVAGFWDLGEASPCAYSSASCSSPGDFAGCKPALP